MRALDLEQQGCKQRDIAAALGATKGAVCQWSTAARHGGREAPLARPGPGTEPKLAPTQIRLIPDFLCHGAEASGLRGDVGTCDRGVDVIEEEFGVASSKGQVSRLPKRLGWTPPIPITRAIPRDEGAIERWRVSPGPR